MSCKAMAIDNTRYTDEQEAFIKQIMSVINWPWLCFSNNDLSIEKKIGKFGDVFVLRICGVCYMTTNAPDLLDHASIYTQASGDVLLTGLGLGLGVLYASANPLVESITVVENNENVIEFIMPMILNSNLRILPKLIKADANFWVPDTRFDFAYIDHAYQRADSERYVDYCNDIANWYDERIKLEALWR